MESVMPIQVLGGLFSEVWMERMATTMRGVEYLEG